MPPPTHMVTTAYLALRRRPSIRAWPVRRAPVMPYGMTDRDRAAIDVELFRIDAELVAAIDHLHRERLVQFPEIDIVDRRVRAA